MKLIWKRILSYFPEALPVGLTAMNQFIDDIIELAGNYADRDSMAWAVCQMIIHTDASKGKLSKQYFVLRLRKASANQVASQVFVDIKERQEAQRKAAVEVTTAPAEVTTDVSKS